MKILYAGGGTLGSVSPLIAVHQQLKSCRDEALPRLYKQQITDYQSLWLGTSKGPEREIVECESIKFKPITSGKLRRYFDLRNIIDLFKIKLGFWQTFFIILKFNPDVILSAGSFVTVPVVWAGWLLGKKIIIHQQDVIPGLANKLCSLFATHITVALRESLKDFSKKKTVLVGNPIRQELRIKNYELSKPKFLQNFGLNENLSTLLVIGGGTGALAINKFVRQSLPELVRFCNIIHITGKNKSDNNYSLLITHYSLQYKSFEFLNAEEMREIYCLADIVISRAGMSTLTELAYFKKPTIIIPIPDSHQEKNAEYFEKHNACIYLKQKKITSENLTSEVRKLLINKDRCKIIKENMNKVFVDYSGEKFLDLVFKII